MKFTLKDYQEEAVGDVLDRGRTAQLRWFWLSVKP